MKEKTGIAETILWSALVLVLLSITVAFVLDLGKGRPVPGSTSPPAIFHNGERAVDQLPVIAPVNPFVLTNQAGAVFSRTNLDAKVWIADIIFTRCPGPCATMTTRMAELQRLIPAHLPVQFVSLTTDPEHDQPAVLARYAEKFSADPARWNFLTGEKADIVEVATAGLKLVARPKEAPDRTSVNDLFIHSTVFAIVDKWGRLRGVFETLGPDAGEDAPVAVVDPWETELKPRLLRAVETLVQEESP